MGVEAVLIQQSENGEATPAYASKILNSAERNYGATEHELFAVIFGIETFQQYLTGNVPLKQITGHGAIVLLLETNNPV